MEDYVIGIDVGATKIALGLMDPEKQSIAQQRVPTNVDEGPQAAAERMVSSIAELEQALPAGQKIAFASIE